MIKIITRPAPGAGSGEQLHGEGGQGRHGQAQRDDEEEDGGVLPRRALAHHGPAHRGEE